MNTKELIFNMYKDTYIAAKRFRSEIRKKFNLSNADITELYVRINNYQIKVYGERLGDSSKYIPIAEDQEKVRTNRRNTRNSRLYGYYENRKVNVKYD